MLGFIGAGNMGSAIINGFIKSGKVKADEICVIRKNNDKLKQMAEETGIIPVYDYDELVKKCDIIFLAVKPVMVPAVADNIKNSLKGCNKLLVSMAAGLTTENISSLLGYDFPIIRIMPNVNANIMQSTTAVCKNAAAKDDDISYIMDLFSAIGSAIPVEENQFSIFSAIAGCSPAYVYMFIDALAKGAVKMGMNKKLALDIAADAVAGSANMLKASGIHPGELTDMVCSPGGTTIEGVCTLDEYKFSASVAKAVENSILKDKSMSK